MSHNNNYLRSTARDAMRESMVVAGHSAVVHWVTHAIVRLIVAHAALIVLQTVRLRDKPWNGGQLHSTSHPPNLHRDRDNNPK